jgi:hypothetical protein
MAPETAAESYWLGYRGKTDMPLLRQIGRFLTHCKTRWTPPHNMTTPTTMIGQAAIAALSIRRTYRATNASPP